MPAPKAVVNDIYFNLRDDDWPHESDVDPIIRFPSRFEIHSLIGAEQNRQLWLAHVDDRPVALRLFRFPEKQRALTPVDTADRQGEIMIALGLRNIAEPLWSGGDRDGLFVSEAWVEGQDLGQLAPCPWDRLARWVRPVVRDLAILHKRGKFHGSIRPSRIVVGKDSATLLAQPWSVALISLREALYIGPDGCLDEQRGAFLDPDFLGPEERLFYPIDQYAFCKTLLAVSDDTMPSKARTLLERGLSPRIMSRTNMLSILELLDSYVIESNNEGSAR